MPRISIRSLSVVGKAASTVCRENPVSPPKEETSCFPMDEADRPPYVEVRSVFRCGSRNGLIAPGPGDGRKETRTGVFMIGVPGQRLGETEISSFMRCVPAAAGRKNVIFRSSGLSLLWTGPDDDLFNNGAVFSFVVRGRKGPQGPDGQSGNISNSTQHGRYPCSCIIP